MPTTEMIPADINLIHPGDVVYEDIMGDYYMKEINRIVDYNLNLVETYEPGIDVTKIEKCSNLYVKS